MSSSMTREAALRIALAARELPGVEPRALVLALGEKLALPLTEAKLATVSVEALSELLVGTDRAGLKAAVRLLWGTDVVGSELPALEPYAEGELPASIRVAIASNSGEQLDGHFGSCERYLIYQLSPTALRLIDQRPTLAADQVEDRNLARAALIADCQIVYVQSIGGAAVAKVVRAGAHPIKVGRGGPARELLAQLQASLRSPPPWLAKVMGVKAMSLAPYVAAAQEQAA